jgi:hypothetical protein
MDGINKEELKKWSQCDKRWFFSHLNQNRILMKGGSLRSITLCAPYILGKNYQSEQVNLIV